MRKTVFACFTKADGAHSSVKYCRHRLCYLNDKTLNYPFLTQNYLNTLYFLFGRTLKKCIVFFDTHGILASAHIPDYFMIFNQNLPVSTRLWICFSHEQFQACILLTVQRVLFCSVRLSPILFGVAECGPPATTRFIHALKTFMNG